MTPRQELRAINEELAECHSQWADDRAKIKELLDTNAIIEAKLDDIRWDVAFVNRQWHEAEHALKLHTADSLVRIFQDELAKARRARKRR